MTAILNLNLKTQFKRLEGLKKIILNGDENAYLVNTVIEVIEDVTGVHGFVEASRSPVFSEKRYMLYYVLYVIGLGCSETAKSTGMHHASVLSGIKRHKELYKDDVLYKKSFDKVVKSLPKI